MNSPNSGCHRARNWWQVLRSTASVSFCLGLVWSVAVLAEDEAAAFEEALNTPISTAASASAYRQSASDAPASVIIVGAEEIAAMNWRDGGQLLAAQPGLHLGSIGPTRYTVAGGYAPATASFGMPILLDGLNLGDPNAATFFLRRDAFLGFAAVDNVEIVRSPASAVYGNGATIGVVNVIPRSGASFGEGGGGEITLKADTRGLVGGAIVGGGTYDGTVVTVQVGGSRVAAGDVDHAHTQNLHFAIERNGFGLDVFHAGQDLPEHQILAPFLSGADEDTATAARLRYELQHGGWTYFAAVTASHLDYMLYTPGLALSPGAFLAFRSEGLRYLGDLRAKYEGERFTSEFGLESVWVQRDRGRTNINGQLSGTFAREAEWLNSPFAELAYQLGHGFTIKAGARLDENSDEHRLAPRAALIWRDPQARHRVKLIYSEAYRAINSLELALNEGIAALPPAGEVSPETIRTGELFYEWRLAPATLLTASYAVFRADDLIGGAVDNSLGFPRAIITNVGVSEGDALELGVEHTFASRWNARISGSWQNSDAPQVYATLADRLFESPEWLLKFRTWGELGSMGTLTGEVLYVGERPGVNFAALDAYWLVNVGYRTPWLRGRYSLGLTLYNALDESAGVALQSDWQRDYEGRALMLEGKVRF
jgi:outer membrane receptor protein involved in Fe transport